MSRILGILGFVLQLVALGNLTSAAELPVETFFRDYEFGEAEISPDGKCLALIAPSKGRRNLLVIDLEKMTPKWLSGFADRDVYSITWASNDRLLLRMVQKGFESGGLFAVNRDGSRASILVHTGEIRKDMRLTHWYSADLLAVLENDPSHALVEASDIEYDSLPDARSHPRVDKLDLFSGKWTTVAENPGNIRHWWTDNQDQVRAAMALDKGKYRLLHRSDAKAEWKVIAEFSSADDHLWPIRFTPDDQNLYVSASNGRKAAGLYVFNIAEGKLAECLWQHADFDVSAVMFGKDHRPLCVFYHTDRPQCQWFDAEWQAIQVGIDRALPDTVNRITDMNSKDESKAVFHCFSDRTPGAYYLYDRTSRRLEKLRDIAGWIKPDEMSPTKPISYVARDGLTIHGYLTVPTGSAGTNLPLVVYPHGGPWTRDKWGFDPDVQFLANRGCAVLQINFRGSTGYGFAFAKAGFKQWGLKMQDDITDGVHWAISQDIADKARVCIYGASYGGYAAMAGLTSTPELYKCGINYAGVTDIVSMLAADAYHQSRLMEYQFQLIGDSAAERDQLQATSPINHVDKIRAPLLLIYGGDDMRVRESQGKRLASELKRQGKTFEMIFVEKEGHGFHIEKNKLEMYRKMDTFLKKNL